MDDAMRAELDRVRQAVAASERKETRAEVCACGHPVKKHAESRGRTLCNAMQATCPCREVRPVAVTPNARIFCFKTSEAGPAILRGWLKAEELGLAERVEWIEGVTCVDCDQRPVTVAAIDGGARNEPRCGVHR